MSTHYRYIQTWPSGKLPFECQRIAKNLTFFPKKLPKIFIFFKKIARRVRSCCRLLVLYGYCQTSTTAYFFLVISTNSTYNMDSSPLCRTLHKSVPLKSTNLCSGFYVPSSVLVLSNASFLAICIMLWWVRKRILPSISDFSLLALFGAPTLFDTFSRLLRHAGLTSVVFISMPPLHSSSSVDTA